MDYYELRDTLESDQVFKCCDGTIIKLDRRVAGDGTKWFIANWSAYHRNWSYEDSTIEPGDLVERLDDWVS